jgi:hypothetical protein
LLAVSGAGGNKFGGTARRSQVTQLATNATTTSGGTTLLAVSGAGGNKFGGTARRSQVTQLAMNNTTTTSGGANSAALFGVNASSNVARADRNNVRMAMLAATNMQNPIAVANPMAVNSVGIGGPRIGMWSQAAKAAQPPPVQNYVAAMIERSRDRVPSRGGGSRGPLDSHNWEGSRVATLRIDNTPGANVTTSGVTMAG